MGIIFHVLKYRSCQKSNLIWILSLIPTTRCVVILFYAESILAKRLQKI